MLGDTLTQRTCETFTFAQRPATKTSANSVQRQYLDFQIAQRLASHADISAGKLPQHTLSWVLFAGWLDARGLEPDSIKVYLAHIRSMYRNSGISFPKRWDLVLLLQKAIRRRRVAEGRVTPKRQRRPLTPALVQKHIEPYIRQNEDNIELVRLYVTILVGVFGVMRSGELTVHTDLEHYSPSLHIHRKGVFLRDTYAEITLPISKTSVDRATIITIPKLPKALRAICPYRALVHWLSRTARESPNSHRFSLNNEAYSKQAFTKLFKQTLSRCHLSPKQFSGHSLRIGGLTALREAGIPEDEAMIIGRWTLAVHRIYWQRTALDHCRQAKVLSTHIQDHGLPSSCPLEFELSLATLMDLGDGVQRA